MTQRRNRIIVLLLTVAVMGSGLVFWLTPFVYGLAKSVIISSSLIPRLHWWSGNSPNGILGIR